MATRRLGNGYSMTKVGTIILTVCFGLAVGTSAQAALNYDPAMRATQRR